MFTKQTSEEKKTQKEVEQKRDHVLTEYYKD